MSSFGGDAAAEFADLIGLSGDEDDELDLEEGDANTEPVWRDLLIEHGSYDGASQERQAFSVMSNAAVGAAPGGEAAGRWIGAAPPLLRLGVVMVSEKSRRAVLGGVVVGVGDLISGGNVLAIEPGTVRLGWQQRQLTYDLENEVPREFRTEHARRRRERQEASDLDEGNAATGSASSNGDQGLNNEQGIEE